jgi:hypothetical protein
MQKSESCETCTKLMHLCDQCAEELANHFADFGDTVIVPDGREGVVLSVTGSTVTIAFYREDSRPGTFGCYMETFDRDKVELA